MTLQELRALDPAALDNELTALLREQFSQRMQRATGQLTVTHGLKKTRRNIARIYTLKREKEKSAK